MRSDVAPARAVVQSATPVDESSWRGALFWWALFLVVFFAKSPDAYLNPQFWAEDGVVFFRDHIESGWASLWAPYAGYLHLIPRLVAGLTSWLPAEIAPTAYNFASLGLNAAFLAHLARTFGDRPSQMAVVVGVLLLPTNGEVFGTITNTQWWGQFYLVSALCRAFKPAMGWSGISWRLVSSLVVGLTGPFSVLVVGAFAVAVATHYALNALAPKLAKLGGYVDVDWRLRVTPVAIAAAIQLGVIASNPSAPAEFSISNAIKAVGFLQAHTIGATLIAPMAFLAIYVSITSITTVFGGSGPRPSLLTVLGGLAFSQMLAASMKMDLLSVELAHGDRYYVAGKVFLACAVVRLAEIACAPAALRTIIVVGLGAIIAFSNADHLQRKALPDLDWRASAALVNAQGGVTIPINPSPFVVVIGKGEHKPGFGRVRFIDLPYSQGGAEAVPLSQETPLIVSFGQPGIAGLSEVQLLIGTYGMEPKGSLSVRACGAKECSTTVVPLEQASDNDYLRARFQKTMLSVPVTTIEIDSKDAGVTIAVWSESRATGSAVMTNGPRPGRAIRLRLVQSLDAAAPSLPEQR